MSAWPLSKMTKAQKEQTETSAPEIYHNNQIAGFLNWTSLIQYTICPEWHDMITKLAWLLLQRYCIKSPWWSQPRLEIRSRLTYTRRKTRYDVHCHNCKFYTWKKADAKCTFVSNAQSLNYNDEVYKMMEYDGICWTIIAGVNLFKWKLFTKFVSHTTWGVSFMKKHAKNLIIAAQDCTQWPFIQHTLDIFPIWLCAFENM